MAQVDDQAGDAVILADYEFTLHGNDELSPSRFEGESLTGLDAFPDSTDALNTLAWLWFVARHTDALEDVEWDEEFQDEDW